jgi:alkylation response protein AidB-like acyl-CoA dehydrogenase
VGAGARAWDLTAVDVVAESDSAGHCSVLRGTATHVLDASHADVLLVAARAVSTYGGEIGLFAVEDFSVDPLATSDLTRRVATVRLAGARATWVGDVHTIEAARRAGLALLAAEQAGGAAACLDQAVAHAKVREQFGRPIGSFQAVKHRCADMLVRVEAARSTARRALADLDADTPDADAAAQMAAVTCAEAYVWAAAANVSVHGGIGFTWEHGAQLHVKRANGAAVLLGNPVAHRRRVGLPGAQVVPAPRGSWREQVRQFLATVERPPGLRDYGATPAAADVCAGRAWQAVLAEQGYACLHWPVALGGGAASVAEQAEFAEECALAGVPRQLGIVGPDLVGPVIMRFGTEDQRVRLLPPIRDGRHLWCQLFSEPDAGSDLASVRTTAVRTTGGWRVDGQKVWTSAGNSADFGILLARTGGPGHRGLSAFVVAMNTDGITARPLRQMDGEAKFNEVFLDGVELPADSLLGEEGAGWSVATLTLGRERFSLGANAVSMFSAVAELAAAARERDLLDACLTDRLAALSTRVWALRSTWERAIADGSDPGSAAFSVLKLMASDTAREIGEAARDCLGADSLGADHPLVARMLVSHAQTILGGTSDIQRNILGERVLGLPREPR